jgi:Putative auto-transporter adhesin, head GIN domain
MQHSLWPAVFKKMLIMKNILLFATISLASLACFGQNNKVINDPNAQKRSVQGFHAIEISSGIDLYLDQSNEEAVAVSASDPEYRDKIKTEVDNGVLRIYLDNKGAHWNWGGNKKLKAYVSCKVIDDLHASGGSDVYIQDPIKSEKLNIDLSGGSDLHGKMVIGDLTVHQSGGSDAFVSGSAGRLTVHASGGSDFHGYDLPADDCRADASGGSDIYMVVNKQLDANASGGSDVHYKGNGVVRESHSSGGGGVSRKS